MLPEHVYYIEGFSGLVPTVYRIHVSFINDIVLRRIRTCEKTGYKMIGLSGPTQHNMMSSPSMYRCYTLEPLLTHMMS